MNRKHIFTYLVISIICFLPKEPVEAQVPIIPPAEEINRAFGKQDMDNFLSPPKVYRPETWFHYIGGNVSLEGITADLEAIAGAGFSGIQLFHGQFGGQWPGTTDQITCLSPMWDNAVRYTAEECRRLGLRLTMQNCPGWAMSGGPWISPENAMRHLVWSRTDVTGGKTPVSEDLPLPQPSDEPWRNYKDITVLAFPTPQDDTGEPLKPSSVKSNREMQWEEYLAGTAAEPHKFSPTTKADPHWVEVTFPAPVKLRTVEFPSINTMNHGQCFEPGISVKVQAILPNGNTHDLVNTDLPQSSWQDESPISFACSEVEGVSTYRIEIVNQYNITFPSLRLFSAARKNNWEAEAGWTLRTIERSCEYPRQSEAAFIDPASILDITEHMDSRGRLNWKAPAGNWTVLRIGHVNTGMKNSPAPPEGTGWECDKLSTNGSSTHFAGYIGRLSGPNGPLAGGLLNGMLMDSWECKTQTWTPLMEDEFERITNYPLRKWLPAVFGFVVGDQQTSGRFLLDWRTVIGELFATKFYGNMQKEAKKNGLDITYETAAGDVFPADILEFFKHADVPMCEFWQPMTKGFVGSLNFKPIKPTASAARVYGKPRVAAEAFTSFDLTWDEHFEMLKEVANVNSVEGVSHLVFHTYTHNPQINFLQPGTSFGSNIGTPFLRGQTWWKHMPEFTDYLSRCSYMLERGKPVSDVLWYLGDEINHKPDQNYPFPEGFKYDYCNPDVLLNRLTVQDGMLVTREGIRYRVMWIPESPRMLPQTLEKIYSLINDGAVVIADAPKGLATLIGGEASLKRFEDGVTKIWGQAPARGVRQIGKGSVFSGMDLHTALNELKLTPDVRGTESLWVHRCIEGADWYFVAAPEGKNVEGTVDFRCTGNVELWDPVTGQRSAVESRRIGDRTQVTLDLPQAGSCFVVFRHTGEPEVLAQTLKPKETMSTITLNQPWTLSFPLGWGAPATVQTQELKAWKDLDISDEGKAFSGTVTYSTTFTCKNVKKGTRFLLDLGKVEMIAAVSVNGKPVRTLWASPYNADITDYVKSGKNELTVEVTGTWFNRLVHDANLPEADRKTWVLHGPSKDAGLRESGLLGPVVLYTE